MAKHGHRLDYAKALSRRRRGWISTKTFDELYEKQSNGCWIWIGSVHKRGYPIFKGWEVARHIALDKAGMKFDSTFHRLRGATCGNKLCVNPEHIKVAKLKHPNY